MPFLKKKYFENQQFLGTTHAGGEAVLPEGHAALGGRLEHSSVLDAGPGRAKRLPVARIGNEVDAVAFRSVSFPGMRHLSFFKNVKIDINLNVLTIYFHLFDCYLLDHKTRLSYT